MEARRAYNTYKKQTDLSTTQGLASFDRDIETQSKNLSRQEQLISQLDPTIIEASQQALKLLRGESSSTLAPIQNQRNMQRQKLLSQLREQLGPGAETSTAGIQALTRFDSETNNLMAGQQQAALSNLGGLSAQFTSQRPDMMREGAYLSSLGQGKTDLGFKQAQGLYTAAQPLQQTAGWNQVSRAQQAALNTARTSAWGDSSFKFGESFGGMGMGSMGGGSKAAPSPATNGTAVNTYTPSTRDYGAIA
jgi:hypothetical protein